MILREEKEVIDIIQANPAISAVREVAEMEGIEAYVIGGYVRDLFLKRESKDIDFVCLGKGVKLAEAVAKKYNTRATVYRKFGTAMINLKGYQLEFVGARKESYRSDSRKPVVEEGSLKDDQDRRDFTINTISVGLNNGIVRLNDPFNGLGDLKKKMIKTPLHPDQTFSDDPLRMMRAIRFASQLIFDIDPDTFTSLETNSERLKIVSMERISEELNKIILSPTPSYGFKLLYHCGLLDYIFPELLKLKGAETREGLSHKDNFYHTLQVLDNIAEYTDDLWLRWAALLHDIAKPATKRFVKGHGWTFHGHEDRGARMVPGIFKKLKLPLGQPMKYVQKLVKLHLRPIALVKDEISDSAVRRLNFEAGDDIVDLMKLCKADITSKNDRKVKQFLRNFERVEKKLEEVEKKDRIRTFQPPVTGEMIMELYDIPPSRIIGDIKEQIKNAILDGDINNNEEEALALLEDIARKKGLRKRA